MNARVTTVLLLLYFSGEVMSVHDKLYGMHIKKWIDTTKKGVHCSAAFQRETGEKDDATCNVVSSRGGMLENGRHLLIGCVKRELNTKLLLLRTTAMLIHRGGGGGEGKWEGMEDDRGEELPPARIVEVTSNRSMPLQGRYILHGYLNSRPHYIKEETVDYKSGNSIHLCWTGSEWNFLVHEDRYLDDGDSIDSCLAYRKGDTLLGEGPSSWFVKSGSAWVSEPTLNITLNVTFNVALKGKTRFEKIQMRQQRHGENPHHHVGSTGGDVVVVEEGRIFQRLWPVYCCHMLDCVCSGIAAPILPFYILGLGANVRHLALIVSSFSLAQTIGSVVMSSVSDHIGRKPVLVGCLIATATSNILLSRSERLISVVCIQVVMGLMGGMKAIAQAAVADIVPIELHPKFIGRLQASVGLGFVFGPMLVAALKTVKSVSTRQIFRFAAVLPLVGLILAIFSFKETKDHHMKCNGIMTATEFVDEEIDKPTAAAPGTIGTCINNAQCNPKWPFPSPVLLLVLNGFLLMYACSIETTVYATFIKDNFGYGETVLSTTFALNGIMVGVLQLVLVKHIVQKLGKHIMLLMGNLTMTVGMVGISLVRSWLLHFLFFSVHILGYSIADTAIISLISRYSVPNMLGRSLGLNQAALGFARVISPLIAGVLYERSKTQGALPMGSLAYLVGSCAPLLAMAIPSFLYIRLLETKVAAHDVSSKPPRAVSKYE